MPTEPYVAVLAIMRLITCKEGVILSGNQSCWVEAAAYRRPDARLSLAAVFTWYNVEIFSLVSSCLRDCTRFVGTKNTPGENSITLWKWIFPWSHSSGDLSSMLSWSSCHYNPPVKQSFPTAAWIGSISASSSVEVFQTRYINTCQTLDADQRGRWIDTLRTAVSIYFTPLSKVSHTESPRAAAHHWLSDLIVGLRFPFCQTSPVTPTIIHTMPLEKIHLRGISNRFSWCFCSMSNKDPEALRMLRHPILPTDCSNV